jgi:hypothetical protein
VLPPAVRDTYSEMTIREQVGMKLPYPLPISRMDLAGRSSRTGLRIQYVNTFPNRVRNWL